MKLPVVLFAVWALLSSGVLSAQSHLQDSTQYLFGTFQEGIVHYKDGRQFQVPLNYHLLGKRFLFIDKNDGGQIKEFADPAMISLVRIGERIFLHDPHMIREVIQMEPPVLVRYKPKVKDKGKRAGYGGYSETSAIDNISGIQSGGIYYKLDTENNIILSRVDKQYYIVHNKKEKSFFNEKSFLKIFSDHKEPLRSYIEENKINFTNITEVVDLYNFAASLSSKNDVRK